MNGRKPGPELRGPQDTVFVPDGDTLRPAVRFHGQADRDTPYGHHCHLPGHGYRGMTGQFVVAEPSGRDSRPAVPAAHPDDGH